MDSTLIQPFNPSSIRSLARKTENLDLSNRKQEQTVESTWILYRCTFYEVFLSPRVPKFLLEIRKIRKIPVGDQESPLERDGLTRCTYPQFQPLN